MPTKFQEEYAKANQICVESGNVIVSEIQARVRAKNPTGLVLSDEYASFLKRYNDLSQKFKDLHKRYLESQQAADLVQTSIKLRSQTIPTTKSESKMLEASQKKISDLTENNQNTEAQLSDVIQEINKLASEMKHRAENLHDIKLPQQPPKLSEEQKNNLSTIESKLNEISIKSEKDRIDILKIFEEYRKSIIAGDQVLYEMKKAILANPTSTNRDMARIDGMISSHQSYLQHYTRTVDTLNSLVERQRKSPRKSIDEAEFKKLATQLETMKEYTGYLKPYIEMQSQSALTESSKTRAQTVATSSPSRSLPSSITKKMLDPGSEPSTTIRDARAQSAPLPDQMRGTSTQTANATPEARPPSAPVPANTLTSSQTRLPPPLIIESPRVRVEPPLPSVLPPQPPRPATPPKKQASAIQSMPSSEASTSFTTEIRAGSNAATSASSSRSHTSRETIKYNNIPLPPLPPGAKRLAERTAAVSSPSSTTPASQTPPSQPSTPAPTNPTLGSTAKITAGLPQTTITSIPIEPTTPEAILEREIDNFNKKVANFAAQKLNQGKPGDKKIESSELDKDRVALLQKVTALYKDKQPEMNAAEFTQLTQKITGKLSEALSNYTAAKQLKPDQQNTTTSAVSTTPLSTPPRAR